MSAQDIRDADGPIVIYCWDGSNRTGVISALYRIVFQGWSKEAAIDELIHGGYGYHALYRNIPHYLREVDVNKITREVKREWQIHRPSGV
jgi:protein tyrosine/serine phosphatase